MFLPAVGSPQVTVVPSWKSEHQHYVVGLLHDIRTCMGGEGLDGREGVLYQLSFNILTICELPVKF